MTHCGDKEAKDPDFQPHRTHRIAYNRTSTITPTFRMRLINTMLPIAMFVIGIAVATPLSCKLERTERHAQLAYDLVDDSADTTSPVPEEVDVVSKWF